MRVNNAIWSLYNVVLGAARLRFARRAATLRVRRSPHTSCAFRAFRYCSLRSQPSASLAQLCLRLFFFHHHHYFFMKIIPFVAFMLFISAAHAQNVHIPDANFKAALLADTAVNTNGDTEIQVGEAAAFSGEINVYKKDITDLTGIEYFTSITKLACSKNKITKLDISKNTALTEVYCWGNKLTQLDLSTNTDLIALNCSFNKLQMLNLVANKKLVILACHKNPLTCIEVSNFDQASEILSRNRRRKTKLITIKIRGIEKKHKRYKKTTYANMPKHVRVSLKCK
jgi:hypothetical protein